MAMTRINTALLTVFMAGWGGSCCARDPMVDSPMFSDPPLKLPEVVHTFPAGLTPLWSKAIQQPEFQLQRQACLAVKRASELGMKGVEEMAPLVVKHLESPNRSVRQAAAMALVQLGHKSSYPQILELCRDDALTATMVEPKLLHVAQALVQEHWRKQLSRTDIQRTQRLLAIRGLGELRDESVGEALHQFAIGRGRSPSIRLAAARSLGLMAAKPSIDFEAWAAKQNWLDRLTLAARIHVKEPTAVAQLKQLSLDKKAAVAIEALNKLASIDKQHLVELSDKLRQSSEAVIRGHSVAGLQLAKKSEQLAKMMNDVHRGVRRSARQALLELATKADLKDQVITLARSYLSQKDWRGKEQAAFILGRLDDKKSAEEVAKHLTHARPEVYIAAAWALRKLAVPSTLPAMLERAQAVTEGIEGAGKQLFRLDDQLIQIFQAFAAMKYVAARDILIVYTNKQGMIPPDPQRRYTTRAAAIYALGKILEGQPLDDTVVELFIARLNDFRGDMPPEGSIVRRFCALGLGRMKAKKAMPLLEEVYIGNEHDFVRGACAWSLEKLTGEPHPLSKTKRGHSGWFLEPARSGSGPARTTGEK